MGAIRLVARSPHYPTLNLGRSLINILTQNRTPRAVTWKIPKNPTFQSALG
ncbi:hypothetical protein H633G_11592 [Metarhizium anisopliae BRIP 53284]|nr:hypothetical protein H633G_11592 [Metarhizium anisopliae BRIP 53284]